VEPVVFFGTGPVAARSLELLSQWCPVEAVITKPRPPHHKGDFPVLTMASKLGLRVMEVTDKQSLNALMAQRPAVSRLAVLVDFGIIVSQEVIDYFPLGIVNSHFSLLPQLRGADPISFAILEGHAKTGVSLMLIDAGMDTGKLLTYRTHHIAPDATTPSLTEELITLSDQLLQEYLPAYAAGSLDPKNQPHPDRATYTRKLTKADSILDTSKSATELERQIRAFLDWPRSRTRLGQTDVVITKAHVADPDEKPVLPLQTADGILAIDQLIPAGRKQMSAAEFVRGYSL